MANLAKLSEPANDDILIGRRGAPRARLQANAALQSVTCEIPVILRNLSCTGAMVQARDLPKPGRTVLLKRGSIEALATVVWSENGRCGLEFFDPLSSDEVVREARTPPEPVSSPPAPYYWRSALPEEGISAEEWEAARAWALKARH